MNNKLPARDQQAATKWVIEFIAELRKKEEGSRWGLDYDVLHNMRVLSLHFTWDTWRGTSMKFRRDYQIVCDDHTYYDDVAESIVHLVEQEMAGQEMAELDE